MLPIVLLGGLLASHPVAPSPCLDLADNAVGSMWTYAGTRLWSVAGSAHADSAAVEWTTTLVGKRPLDSGYVLLVRGFVSELAWSDPTTKPRLSILACERDRLLHREFMADSEAVRAFAHWTDSLAAAASLLVQEPLADGTVFGQDPPRSDDMYGWSVEQVPHLSGLPGSCHASGGGWRLTMRTLPDHQVVEWRPRVGVTAFQYGHHGTPAAAEVHLIRCA